MKERRQFLKAAVGVFAGVGVLFTPLLSIFRSLGAGEKKTILVKGTKRESLINLNPGNLDARNLDLTPLKDFRTMGTTDYQVDLDQWRLEIKGRVKNPLALTHSQVLALPSDEKRVLLICPGFFANYGQWKGILMGDLFKKVEPEKGAAHVTFTSSETPYERDEKFPLGDVLSGKVFLAYAVNGEALPQKHGFPLQEIVAEGEYGSRWIKYVSKAKIE